MLALMDGDILLYSAGYASERPVYQVYVDGEETPLHSFTYHRQLMDWISSCDQSFLDTLEILELREAEPVQLAYYNMDMMIKNIVDKTKATEIIILLSGKTNFREEVATIAEYKGTRDRTKKPVHYDALKGYIKSKYPYEVSVNEEADDLLGIKATQLNKKGIDAIICTKDKDLNMIPGWHFNMNKDKMVYIDPIEAIKFFYTQLLTGDQIDNIKGVKGVGKARAAKLLEDLDDEVDLYNAVYEKYVQVYGEDAYKVLFENAQLLWIRRQENEVWSPPT